MAFEKWTDQNSLSECPKCGIIAEVSEGKPDYNMKDDKGEPMTEEAADHLAKFRVRCSCGENYCSSCKTNPYHTGKTCDQLREHLKAYKCQ